MAKLIVFILTLSCLAATESNEKFITSSLSNDQANEDIPAEFSWTSLGNTNYVSQVRNQHSPQFCQSGWAFAATSALSDRIRILRRLAGEEVILSPQVLLSCSNENQGCSGGSPLEAYRYIANNYITDEACSNYQARGHTNGLECSAMIKCKECGKLTEECFVPDHQEYKITEFGSILGEDKMKEEIVKGGPIACEVETDSTWTDYKGGVLRKQREGTKVNHVVTVVGYGSENTQSGEVAYWLIKNSWGSSWGEEGFIRLERGVNAGLIESSECAWAKPVDTWTEPVIHRVTEEEQKDPRNSKSVGFDPNDPAKKENVRCRLFSNEEKPMHEGRFRKLESLPEQLDWRSKEGKNYLSPVKNQHIPVYCGSCWSQSVSSVMADKINIARGHSEVPVNISAQVLVNCNGGGSCYGGLPNLAFSFAMSHGLPDDSCQQYTARNQLQGVCTAEQVCQTCEGPLPGETESGQGKCKATTPKLYFVSDFGFVRGAENMKRELQNGPIECGIASTNELHAYRGGIFEQEDDKTEINHSVSLIGYGIEDGVEYWIMRNSWGTWWGERGFAKVRMHKNNLKLETDCQWADIDRERSGI